MQYTMHNTIYKYV